MKRFISLLAVIAICFSFTGCGSVSALPSDNGGGKPSVTEPPDKPVIPPEKVKFSVRLEYDGEPYIPEIEMSAVWKSVEGESITDPVPFNSEGIAELGEELDGEFLVTLTQVPDGFTYNPNVCVANADNPRRVITLYKLGHLRGSGSDYYSNVKSIINLGAYRLTFTEPYQKIYCQFEPKVNGVFAIESIMDISENAVNPRLDVYIGSRQYKPPYNSPSMAINGGGEESTYTKNFRYDVKITQDMIGSVFAFGVKFDTTMQEPISKSNPVYVDFIVTRNGDFVMEDTVYEWVFPTEDVLDEDGSVKYAPEGRGAFTYAYRRDGAYKVLETKQITKGEDGFYYYVRADGSAAPLYAKLTQPNELVDFGATDNGAYMVRLRFNGKNYGYLLRGYSALTELLSPDKEEDKKILDKYNGKRSYCDATNSDGAYPVNEQIKQFLYEFSRDNSYFFDGWGWAEEHNYASNDEDQWLFACGYYS